jgi:hypothetical protein
MERRFCPEPPEDGGILNSRADLEESRPQESSESIREHTWDRTADRLKQMELRANFEAEAQAAHVEAAASCVQLAASPATIPLTVDWEGGFELEEQVELMRSAALRAAAHQARRNAAERLEVARRAEAAALADSIARREDREFAEAQATLLRQAAKYAEEQMRRSQRRSLHSEFSRARRSGDPRATRLVAKGDPQEQCAVKQSLELFDPSADSMPHRVEQALAPRVHKERNEASHTTNGNPGLPDRKLAPDRVFVPPVQREESGLCRSVPEIVNQISEFRLDDPCWCEADSLIGCGYSQSGFVDLTASSSRKATARRRCLEGESHDAQADLL